MWQMFGGDEWCTYDELDEFFRAADQIIDDRKKAADKTKKQSGRRHRPFPHRRRR